MKRKEKIQLRATWRKIRNEYKKDSQVTYFICEKSETFKMFWICIQEKNKIKSVAKRFLIEKEQNNRFMVSIYSLFVLKSANNMSIEEIIDEYGNIRLEFLNWMVKTGYKLI